MRTIAPILHSNILFAVTFVICATIFPQVLVADAATTYKLMHANVTAAKTVLSTTQESIKDRTSIIKPKTGMVYDYQNTDEFQNILQKLPKRDALVRVPFNNQGSSIIQVTSYVVNNITTQSAFITFNTNTPAKSFIEYGLEGHVSKKVEVSPIATEQHQIKISDLYPGTEYILFIQIQDASGTTQDERKIKFKTLKLREEPNITIKENGKNNLAASLGALGNIHKQEDGSFSVGSISIIDMLKEKVPIPVLDKDTYLKQREQSEQDFKYARGVPLNMTPAVTATNEVTLTKKFDIHTFSDLYRLATFNQRIRIQEIEPALFAIDGIINGSVFKVLDARKRALITGVISKIDNVSVINNLINLKKPLSAKIQERTALIQWSAYAGSNILFTFKDNYFPKPLKALTIRSGGATHKAIYMSDGSWHVSVPAANISGTHDLDINIEYLDNTFDIHKTKIKVLDLPQIIGVRDGTYTRIGSSIISVYRGVHEPMANATSWVLYTEDTQTENPQITNQNGEFAMVLPSGMYKFAVRAKGYDSVSQTIVNHPGGILSASVILSESSESALFMTIFQYLIIIMIIIASLYGIMRIKREKKDPKEPLEVKSKNIHLIKRDEIKKDISDTKKKKRKKKKIKKMLVIMVMGIFVSQSSIAYAAPNMVRYNGVLAAQEDGRITNAGKSITMNFNIYDTEYDGEIINTYSQYVSVTKGVFSVDLPIEKMSNSKEYWVELIIDDQSLGRSKLEVGIPVVLNKNEVPQSNIIKTKQYIPHDKIEKEHAYIIPQDPFTNISYYERSTANLENLSLSLSDDGKSNNVFMKIIASIKDMYAMIVTNTTSIEYNKKEIEDLHNRDTEFDSRINRLEKNIL